MRHPSAAVLRRLGYSSAYKAVHGSEPPVSAGPILLCDCWAADGAFVWSLAPIQCHVFCIHQPNLLSCHTTPLQGTWPTGIQAPLMDEGDFECLDYVYVWSAPGYDVK